MRNSLTPLLALLVLCGCGQPNEDTNVEPSQPEQPALSQSPSGQKVESYYDSGKLKVSGYLNEQGQQIGEWTTYHENGHVWEQMQYQDGKPHGEGAQYHSNGQLAAKAQYADGKWHGDWSAYYESGQMQVKGQYKNGKKDGDWIRYDETGTVTRQGVYEAGRFVSGDRFHD